MLLSLLVPIGVGAQDAVITVGGYAPEQFEQQFGSTVSFDATTNTLTLNNLGSEAPYSPSTDFVESSLVNLTVKIEGACSLQLPQANVTYAFKTTSQSAYITFVTDNPTSSLTISGVSSSPFSGFGQNNIIYKNDLEGATAETTGTIFTIAVPDTEYGISIVTGTNDGTINITKRNRLNVTDGVQFDGVKTLILTSANLAGITISADNTLTQGLVVYLLGDNTIQNGTYAIQSSASIPLTITTSEEEPGTLAYICSTCTLQVANSAFNGFETITYKNRLAAMLDYTPEQASSLQTPQQTVTITPALVPVVLHSEDVANLDGEGEGLGKALEAQTTATQVITADKKMLMTLGSDDGFFNWTPSTTEDDAGLWDGDESAKLVVLSTEQDDVPEDKEPCTAAFNEAFKGIAMAVPAGVYDVTCDYKNIGNGRLVVQAGSGAHVKKATFEEMTSHAKATHSVSLAKSGYIFIYNWHSTPNFSRGRAPGRKMANTTSLKSVKVSARSCASAPPPPASPVTLTKVDVAAAKTDNHITVTDDNVVGFEDDAFEDYKTAGITYVDLSATSISSLIVDREKLPENAIILLPAGNDAGTAKNVVVGGVCEDLELSDERTFDIPSDFTAVKVAQTREYTAGKNSTICLPYALDATQVAALGTFYEPTTMSAGKVTMTSVEKTDANTPYMFKPKTGVTKVSAEMVDVKAPAGAQVSGSLDFTGTYTAMSINSGTKQYYCFSEEGTFLHVTSAVNVLPFRAYFERDTALGRSLDIDYGDGTTGISNVQSLKFNDQSYYDLQGRRVLYPKKGLYILNGKKVIIK